MKIFITGVSSGLGQELAKQLLNEEHEVWGISRSGRDKINPFFLDNKNFCYSTCDTTDTNQISTIFDEMMARNFLPDAVVLCAASQENDISKNNFSSEKFREVFNINFFGYFNWLEKFLPIFQKNNKGIFVAVSSFTGYFPMTRDKIWCAYPVSKAAVNMLFNSLSWAFTNSNLRFLLFVPGRMMDKKAFLSGTYQGAAGKIIRFINSNQGSRIIFYPLLNYIILRIISFLPYRFIRNFVRI